MSLPSGRCAYSRSRSQITVHKSTRPDVLRRSSHMLAACTSGSRTPGSFAWSIAALGGCHRPARAPLHKHGGWSPLAAAAARMQHTAQQLETAPVIVVGGGAAGLTAAYFAAQAGAKVLVLERTREAGKKVLMSGGTRCNVLPLEVDLGRDFTSSSPGSALRALFSTWSLEQCLSWLSADIGLELQLEVDTNKWFPASNSGREVRDKLLAACRDAGVRFRYGASVEGIQALGAAQGTGQAGSSNQQEPGEAGVVPANVRGPSQTGADSDQIPDTTGADQQQQEPAATPPQQSPGRSKRRARSRTGGSQERQPQAQVLGPDAGWQVSCSDGSTWVTRQLVLATGGLSFPAVGTDGTGHRLLEALGHTLVPPYPALTPLLGGHPGGEQLAGLTLPEVQLEAWPPGATPGGKRRPLGVSQRGGFLFTHRGYSGPAVLDLSHWEVTALEAASQHATGSNNSSNSSSGGGGASNSSSRQQQRGQSPSQEAAGKRSSQGQHAVPGVPVLTVNWISRSEQYWEALLTPSSSSTSSSSSGSSGTPSLPGSTRVVAALRKGGLPERLADALVASLGLGGVVLGQLRREQRGALVEGLTRWRLEVRGHEGYKKAEVTGGGVPLTQVDCRTLESRVLPGVFLCGELLDVFGRIGGFNFYLAWLSGRAAGLGAAAAAAQQWQQAANEGEAVPEQQAAHAA